MERDLAAMRAWTGNSRPIRQRLAAARTSRRIYRHTKWLLGKTMSCAPSLLKSTTRLWARKGRHYHRAHFKIKKLMLSVKDKDLAQCTPPPHKGPGHLAGG